MTEAMKRTYRYFILTAAVALTAGCVQEEVPEVGSAVEITAAMEHEADTRTTLSGLEDGMYYSLWAAEDEIAVYADNDVDPSKFILSSGEGSSVATFSGNRKGNEYHAVYPYDIAGAISDGIVNVILPDTQKYVKDSFGPGAFPMFAEAPAGDGLRFMNLCSVLKISLTGTAAVKSVTVTANDETTSLSGPASVVIGQSESSGKLLTMSAGGSRSVVLTTKGLEISEDAPADVFIVVPAQTYKGGLTIEVDTYNEKFTKTVTSDIVFERSQLRAIRNFELDAEVPDIIPEAIMDNEIWYVTESGFKLGISNDSSFGANIIEHTYQDGLGVITFDGDVTHLPSINVDDLLKLYLPSTLKTVEANNPLRMCRKLQGIYGEAASVDNRCLVLDNEIYAFASYGLEEYTIPDGITGIKSYAFQSATLKKIVIPEGVETVGNDAFNGVGSLEEVYLPSTLETLEFYAFANCTGVKKFYGSNKFISDDGYYLYVDNYNNMGKRYLVAFASGAGLTSYVIPEGIEGIESYSFCNATDLQELTFPSTLSTISSFEAFKGTDNIERIYGENVIDNRSLVINETLIYVAPKGLKDYTTPDGVTHIGLGALAYKPELETVVFSDEVVKVGDNDPDAMSSLGYILIGNPNLTSVTMSARITWLGYDPWGWDPSDKLTSVYLRAPIPPGVKHNSPDRLPSFFPNLTIYIPDIAYNNYMSSAEWEPYKGYFEAYDYGDLSEFYPDYYFSTDYSADGTFKTLQTATVGNGIDVVLMGDAYSDRQIADGTYEADMEYMYEKLFTEEPFLTYKEMFNVYYVNVVSKTEGYDNPGSAFDCFFGDGTLVGGTDSKCFEYALNAISEERMDEALVIVAMNSNAYAGTCYMYHPTNPTGTYGSGPSVAYFPKGDDPQTFAQLLHHEANGHGFAKLADEYAYENLGEISSDEVSTTREQQSAWGWWKNVDFTSDPEKVRWSHFLEDERYQYDGLGVFEGGLTYWTGVWRSTENSIMRYNTGGFNAPCREAIYYRIHKLAYGDSWEYDYETFVEYDAVNRATSASAPKKARRNYVELPPEPTTPPVIVGRTWKDAE